MSAPTAAQIETLLNFLEHRSLARGNLRSVEIRVLSHRLWDEICTALNAMGGYSKTTKQCQKVWTDKNYLAKKAAVPARRSAKATGGGPSTTPQVSEWESLVISIMGDEFGKPQKTAIVPSFNEPAQEPSTQGPAAVLMSQQEGYLLAASEPHSEGQPTDPDLHVLPGPSRVDPVSHTRMYHPKYSKCPQENKEEFGGSLCFELMAQSGKAYKVKEQRVECERQRNEELSAIRRALFELCVCVRQPYE